MMGAIKRWGLAIVLLIAFAGALQFGLLGFLFSDEENNLDCLDFYLIPKPEAIALQLVNEAGMRPEAVNSFAYVVKEGEISMSLSTAAGIYAQPICWRGDPVVPEAVFYMLNEPIE